jgi:RND family efflux transporter MFP subunit
MRTANVLLLLLAIVLTLGVACSKNNGEAATYHCPMHPTYVADGPGSCPICGMDLVKMDAPAPAPAPAPAQGAAAVYACPMNCEPPSEQPGKCSKCGMDLVPADGYVCPMLCEPSAKGPGKCGKCGMDLVPVRKGVLQNTASEGAKQVLYYRNPMDPSVTSPVPMKDGMGMDYVPVYADDAVPAAAPRGMATVRLTAEGLDLSGARTEAAVEGALSRSIRAVGTVAADETRVRHVHTKIAGWVEKLHVNFTGQAVRKGQPLLDLYSPELLASQEEYLNALRAQKRFEGSALPEVREGARDLLEAARRRLALLDVPEAFIRNLESTGKVSRTVTLDAPASGYALGKAVVEGHQVEPGMELYAITDLSSVWVEAGVYEAEAPYIRVGTAGEVLLPDDPGAPIEGKVTFILPALDPDTRTLRVRLQVPNGGLRLKPGMFAEVLLRAESASGVLIPDSDLLDTGARRIVFVETAAGVFEPREVEAGLRGEGKVLVRSGVAAGERVAVKANFLLDSESRIKAAIQPAGDRRP